MYVRHGGETTTPEYYHNVIMTIMSDAMVDSMESKDNFSPQRDTGTTTLLTAWFFKWRFYFYSSLSEKTTSNTSFLMQKHKTTSKC